MRMSSALPHFPINTFVVCTKTALPFPLTFQSRLTLVSLLGGMGVEDQQNGLYDVWILLDVILFFLMGLDQSGSRPIKTKNTDGLHLRIFDIFAAVPLDFLRKSFESLSSRLQKCVQVLVTSDGSVEYTWYKNCSSIAFSLRETFVSYCVFPLQLPRCIL